ncbi:hypothetical protein [Budvicia aquatica]|uniref:Uncharacterized protein n=1 Tax=Budvicia aquatica TaxID=82979 RepID=A0A2C6DI43_9GAMM|nr:hypothetical protein [Budvicia aquatica]PHI30876.1 hypothetical protein CRN84_16800 [Budvicia aquatica]VFS50735.1 Uncharacterised protein [Budvicia aquatica]
MKNDDDELVPFEYARQYTFENESAYIDYVSSLMAVYGNSSTLDPHYAIRLLKAFSIGIKSGYKVPDKLNTHIADAISVYMKKVEYSELFWGKDSDKKRRAYKGDLEDALGISLGKGEKYRDNCSLDWEIKIAAYCIITEHWQRWRKIDANKTKKYRISIKRAVSDIVQKYKLKEEKVETILREKTWRDLVNIYIENQESQELDLVEPTLTSVKPQKGD